MIVYVCVCLCVVLCACSDAYFLILGRKMDI